MNGSRTFHFDPNNKQRLQHHSQCVQFDLERQLIHHRRSADLQNLEIRRHLAPPASSDTNLMHYDGCGQQHPNYLNYWHLHQQNQQYSWNQYQYQQQQQQQYQGQLPQQALQYRQLSYQYQQSQQLQQPPQQEQSSYRPLMLSPPGFPPLPHSGSHFKNQIMETNRSENTVVVKKTKEAQTDSLELIRMSLSITEVQSVSVGCENDSNSETPATSNAPRIPHQQLEEVEDGDYVEPLNETVHPDYADMALCEFTDAGGVRLIKTDSKEFRKEMKKIEKKKEYLAKKDHYESQDSKQSCCLTDLIKYAQTHEIKNFGMKLTEGVDPNNRKYR
uniref:SH2 domain-containing protein n=1 Tax=Caenorhabditis tropicalis TaxID=1561998 RepID=A0A1I7USF4_9PELO